MSSDGANVDVAKLVADAKLGRQHIAILLLSALMLFIDGFDMSTAGVAAPSLLKAFHGEKAAMGTIFGASYAGILVGCWIFGYVSDRWGRKAGSIWSCVVYGLPSLLITQATSLDHILYLRFLVGIGLGGVMPTTLALLAEIGTEELSRELCDAGAVRLPAGRRDGGPSRRASHSDLRLASRLLCRWYRRPRVERRADFHPTGIAAILGVA